MLHGWKVYQVFHTQQMTPEQKVMTILVEVVQVVMELRGIKNKTPQFLHKCNLSYAGYFMNSHPT
jgi:hypothetical protein